MRVGLRLVFFGNSNRYIERVETGRLKSIRCLWISLKKMILDKHTF